ncbi:MAG: LemA family protein [Nitrospirae bacterium]|nr:LemA family protein [Nitrospirota bacterium]
MALIATVAVVVSVLVAVWRLTRVRAIVRRRDQARERLYNTLRERQELTVLLVELCVGYLVMERPLVEAVALSRSSAMQARTVLARNKTETDLCWALARLLAAAEGHADLMHHPRFRWAATELAALEDNAARATLAYNAQVEALNQVLASPVGGVAARLLGARPGEAFELDPKLAREAMMTLMASGPAHPAPRVPAGSMAFAV